jgi:hypothetical protein
MPGLVPGIHVLTSRKDVDGRDEPGHDDEREKSRLFGKSLLQHLAQDLSADAFIGQ